MATMDYSKSSPFNAREGDWLFALPDDTSNALSVGQSTLPRGDIQSASVALTSGQMRLRYFTSVKTETVTQTRTLTGNTAAATPTLCRVGLYIVEANSDITLVASTPNDLTLWAAATTRYTKALSAPYDLVRGTRYALGILYIGTTTPTMYGANVLLAAETFEEPRLNASIGSLSDLPSTVANGSLASLTSGIYSVILP